DRGLLGRDLRLADADLVRGVALGLAGAALRLLQAELLLLDGLLRGVGERAGRLDVGARGLGGGDDLIVALLRDRALTEEELVAREVGLGARVVGLGGVHLGERRLRVA